MKTRWQRLAQVLQNSSDLIAAVTTTEVNAYQRALQALRDLSEQEQIPIALIGGAATIHHGYPRSTKDLDIVVSVPDFDKILKVAYKYGFDIVSWQDFGVHEFSYEGIPVEVIQEGHFDRDLPPHPKDLGVTQGMQPANLLGWTLLKLGAARMKDLADVVEVFKTKPPQVHQQISEQIYDKAPHLYSTWEQVENSLRKER